MAAAIPSIKPSSTYDPARPTPLLEKLPVELRYSIYDYLLHACPSSSISRVLHWAPGKLLRFRARPEAYHSSVLLVNRQLNAEFKDAHGFLQRTKNLKLDFDIVFPLGWANRSLPMPTLTWNIFPTLRPHVDQIQLNVRFEIQKMEYFEEDNLAKCVYGGVPGVMFMVIMRLFRHLDNTVKIEGLLETDPKPLIVDCLVINVLQPTHTLDEPKNERTDDDHNQLIPKNHPGYGKLFKALRRQLIESVKMQCPPVHQRPTTDTDPRLGNMKLVMCGKTIWEKFPDKSS
jgi:hypothetical protein